MNVDISLIRDFIQTYGLFMQVVVLIAYLMLNRARSTLPYCLLLVIVVTIIHFLIEKELLILGQNPKYEQFVYNLWYLGFASSDALLVILLIYISKKKQLIIDSISRMILISYFCLGVVQIARYIDRIIIETDVLGPVYSIVIPTINIGVTVLVCVYVVYLYCCRLVGKPD